MEFIADGSTALAALRQPGIKGTIRRIKLDGPLADKELEKRLNNAYFACGCTEGSVAVFTALTGTLMFGLLLGFEGALSWWYIALYLAAAALIGKLVGLVRARVRLSQLYRLLEVRARAGEVPTEEALG